MNREQYQINVNYYMPILYPHIYLQCNKKVNMYVWRKLFMCNCFMIITLCKHLKFKFSVTKRECLQSKLDASFEKNKYACLIYHIFSSSEHSSS